MYKNILSSSSSQGIGFVGVLTIVFITLKFVGYLSWSWLWVLSPLWVAAILIAIIRLVVLLIVLRAR